MRTGRKKLVSATKNVPNMRDNYYDMVKGIVALNIIVIHTAFWSGTEYVPQFLRNLSLIADVPAFIFLSGAGQHYVKSFSRQCSSLLKLYIKWLLFLPIYWGLIFLCGGSITLASVRNLLYIGGPEQEYLPVVMGSTWFWPVYFVCVCLGAFVVRKLKDIRLAYVLWGGGIFYIAANAAFIVIPNVLIKQGIKLLFYFLIWLFGYFTYNSKISRRNVIIIEVFLVAIATPCVLFSCVETRIPTMQRMKSPPLIPYAALSLIIPILVIFIKQFSNKKGVPFLNWVGRNSLMFYFAQGISSSLIYQVAEKILYLWPVKFLIILFANCILALVFVLLLKVYYRALDLFISRAEITCS